MWNDNTNEVLGKTFKFQDGVYSRCCGSAKRKLTDLQLLTFELAVYSAIEAGIKFLNRDEDKTTTNISAS